jgi:hypothetical protein
MSTDDRTGIAKRVAEADLDIEAPDAYTMLASMLVFTIARELSAAAAPVGWVALVMVYTYGIGIALMLVAISDIDVREHGRAVAGTAFAALLAALTATYLLIHGVPPQTDVVAFLGRAMDGVLTGTNPYTLQFSNLAPPPSPQVNGEHVTRYSYPPGAIVAALPFRLLGDRWGRGAVLAATAGLGALLIHTASNDLAPLALASLLVDQNIAWALGDLIDPLWMLPLAVAIYYWPASHVGRDSIVRSGIAFGVAAAMKQQPWFCGPFLLAWAWQAYGRREAARWLAAGVGTTVLITLPFFLTAPEATLRGILTPVFGNGAPLVHRGSGLAATTYTGLFPIAKWAHTALMLLATGVSLVAYCLDERLRWTAWVAFAPLLFVNYRSFTTYFVAAVPIAMYVFLCQRQPDRGGEPNVAAA